jgi:hypothetical protein
MLKFIHIQSKPSILIYQIAKLIDYAGGGGYDDQTTYLAACLCAYHHVHIPYI